MEKTYQPHLIEAHWSTVWETAGCFKPENDEPGAADKKYCIMLPPPNVTGSLHMGHGFQHTLMDMLIRYHRLCGHRVLWQGGTDHAGIATQMVVERNLEKENITRESLGREKFIEKIVEWKAHSGSLISRQMRRLGTSIDWSRERFTFDDHFQQAVNHAFIKLYQDGLIYRGKRLVNWDIKLQTAVSDLEVVSSEEDGSLWHLKYYLVDEPDAFITVATTRPETLFGDIAVAVNPNDPRFQHWIGKTVRLPLTDKTIDIIADEYVEMDFGSGCVKITPAHDFNDYEVAKRHDRLKDMINILNKNGSLNHLTPYENMDRLKARKLIVAALSEKGLLEKTEKYKVKTPRCERTGEIIEPLLTDQWYIRMQPLAERAKSVIESRELSFVPENWGKIYLQWLDNIQDWCISRQLWWGHRLPVYYNDKTGEVYVGNDKNKIEQESLRQDEDVLDTWFSAALWPFTTLGWPDKTPEFEQFYPTNVLVTGFDIIFFWVARMVMFGLYFTDRVPFKEVYITGLIRDQHGNKMSKSKGNVLDPIDLIDGISLNDLVEKRTMGLMNPNMEAKITAATQKEFPEGLSAYGTDALRFTYCALANTGRDIRFDLGRIGGYRNFCNKLWNAARFVIGKASENIPASGLDLTLETTNFSVFDQYILSRLQETIKSVHTHFEQYRFDMIAQSLYDFVWHDYCDWYLEFSKINLNVPVLVSVLKQMLILLHPVMPYITEELHQRLGSELQLQPQTQFIQKEKYPIVKEEWEFNDALKKIAFLKAVVNGIRNVRSERQIPPSKKLPVLFWDPENQYSEWMNLFQKEIIFLARLENVEKTTEAVSSSLMVVVGEMQLFVLLSEEVGHIDLALESARLKKEIQKIMAELEKSRLKLNNQEYVNKAPQTVVDKEREREAENAAYLTKLELQLKKLQ